MANAQLNLTVHSSRTYGWQWPFKARWPRSRQCRL